MNDKQLINVIKEWLKNNIDNNIDITLEDNKLLLSYINRIQNKKDKI
jgi:hypothetical protein